MNTNSTIYRELKVGDILQAGDEVRCFINRDEWIPTTLIGCTICAEDAKDYRRPVQPSAGPKTIDEVYGQPEGTFKTMREAGLLGDDASVDRLLTQFEAAAKSAPPAPATAQAKKPRNVCVLDFNSTSFPTDFERLQCGCVRCLVQLNAQAEPGDGELVRFRVAWESGTLATSGNGDVCLYDQVKAIIERYEKRWADLSAKMSGVSRLRQLTEDNQYAALEQVEKLKKENASLRDAIKAAMGRGAK